MEDSEDKKHVNSLEKRIKGSDHEATSKLKFEIELLDQELRELQQNLKPYENLIYEQLRNEFGQLATLSELHKKYTKDKKQKRQEQKERGKNYKAAKNLIKANPKETNVSTNKDLIKADLKKIYREAINKIHPDKISHKSDETAIYTATELTAQLNKLYKNGDLEDLKFFYYTLTDENLLKTNGPNKNLPANDYYKLLIKEQQNLEAEIKALMDTSFFYYFNQNKKPQEFIDDLRERLLIKIKKLKKRTKGIN